MPHHTKNRTRSGAAVTETAKTKKSSRLSVRFGRTPTSPVKRRAKTAVTREAATIPAGIRSAG